ncbi:MAG: hypothetical protein IT175_10265 [Acidobacteria bacterium]|nr:hypothetical protein [Acidobacteriota bacterium]
MLAPLVLVEWEPATSGTFFLRNTNSHGPADITPFTFGAPNKTPLAGDCNADVTDTAGVYSNETAAWFLTNANVAGAVAGFTFTHGVAGQAGLVGDWDGRMPLQCEWTGLTGFFEDLHEQ